MEMSETRKKYFDKRFKEDPGRIVQFKGKHEDAFYHVPTNELLFEAFYQMILSNHEQYWYGWFLEEREVKAPSIARDEKFEDESMQEAHEKLWKDYDEEMKQEKIRLQAGDSLRAILDESYDFRDGEVVLWWQKYCYGEYEGFRIHYGSVAGYRKHFDYTAQ
jgi:hypothetical protein